MTIYEIHIRSRAMMMKMMQSLCKVNNHRRRKTRMMKRKELQRYTVQLLAECFATCVLILIGEAGIANYKFARSTSHSTLPIAISFGVGVYSGNTNLSDDKKYLCLRFRVLAMMVAGPISGRIEYLSL